MKKSNILIAAFAVIMAVSMAGAEMADVNFDPRLPQTERLKAFTGIGTVENDLPAITLHTAASNTESAIFRKLDGDGLQRLRKEMFDIPGLPKEFFQAINSKNVIVFYNNYGVSLITEVGRNAYVMLWESNKWLIKLLTEQEAEVQMGFRKGGTVTVPSSPSTGPIGGEGLNGVHDTGVGSGGFTGGGGSCGGVSGIACHDTVPN